MKLLFVAGARPNFMKIAPLMRALPRQPQLEGQLVHTGQHYDYAMSRTFFEDLDIPEPDHFLNAGSGSHAEQTGKIMVAFEQVCLAQKPDMVVVVGDVNSTLACSVTAKKLHIQVAHVEAGLRSGDMRMPEEVNRLVTDAIADVLYVSEGSGLENLAREGRSDVAHLVGNVMIDTLHYCRAKLAERDVPTYPEPRGVVTLHRPANVDNRETLTGLIEGLARIAQDMPLYFPMHPRTKARVEELGLQPLLDATPSLHILPPASYLDFLALWQGAAAVFTDSGGIQEETTALGIPCFTMRENTERPITVTEGTNILVGTTKAGLLEAYEAFARGDVKTGRVPDKWDGRTAERIVDHLATLTPGGRA